MRLRPHAPSGLAQNCIVRVFRSARAPDAVLRQTRRVVRAQMRRAHLCGFRVFHSTFDIRHSTFDIRHPTFEHSTFDHSIIRPFDYSTIRLFDHSTIRPFHSLPWRFPNFSCEKTAAPPEIKGEVAIFISRQVKTPFPIFLGNSERLGSREGPAAAEKMRNLQPIGLMLRVAKFGIIYNQRPLG